MISYLGFGCLILVLAVLVAAMSFNRFRVFLIILAFISSFYFLTTVPNYFGYAVDDTFVYGKEGIVVSNAIIGDLIFMLVRFKGEQEPRLIKLPKTESNEKKLENQTAPMIIRFGAQAAGAGDGPGGTLDSHGFQILDFSQSTIMGKQQL